jgi:hypothetical protein
MPRLKAAPRPIGAQARARLLAAITKARLCLDELLSGKTADIAAIAAREAVTQSPNLSSDNGKSSKGRHV